VCDRGLNLGLFVAVENLGMGGGARVGSARLEILGRFAPHKFTASHAITAFDQDYTPRYCYRDE